MSFEAILAEVQSWPLADRLRLIKEVWDGISEDEGEPELTDELKAELDRRLQALNENPDAVVPWATLEARARSRYRKYVARSTRSVRDLGQQRGMRAP